MNPEQAQAELARRELARREIARRSTSNPSAIEDSGKFGAISKPPTMMERVGTNLTSKRTHPTGMTGALGIGLSAAGIPEEDILPAVGQGFGGLASGFTGAGFLGATGGAMAGQAGRQAFKSMRGEKPDIGAVGKEGLVTGAIEGVTRGAGNVFFRKQIANDVLNQLGNKLASMKQEMANNPNLKAPVYDIYHNISSAFNSLPEPMQKGSVANKLKDWMKYMSNKYELTAKDLIMMEEDLGKAAHYGEVSKGVFMPATELPNAATNKIAKTGRSQVSDLVDDLAEKGGQKGFKKTSKELSKRIAKSKDLDPTKNYGSFSGRMGAAIGATALSGGNPLAGVAAYAADKTLQSAGLRNALYALTKNKVISGAGKLAKLSGSEAARRA